MPGPALLASSNELGTTPPLTGWPNAFMSYTLQATPIVLNGVDTQTIENLSFNNMYRATGQPIYLEDCANITIQNIDTRGCTMGLVYALNCTDIIIDRIRVENVAQEFSGQVLNVDWGNENDGNLYQLDKCDGFTVTNIKGRYGNTEDVLSHFASDNGTVDEVHWEGAMTTAQTTSDGRDSVPWTSDSGTGCIVGDSDGDSIAITNSTFLNAGQIGIAIAGGTGNSYDSCIVYHEATTQTINTSNSYIWKTPGATTCATASMTNCDCYYEDGGGLWDAGNCGTPDITGSNFTNSGLDPEDYRVTL